MKEFITTTQNLWNFPEGVKIIVESDNYYAHRARQDKDVADSNDNVLRLITNSIQNNIVIATSDTFKALDAMHDKGFIAISAHLKVVARNSLKVLITVSDADFAKESFLGLYSLVREIEDDSKTDSYAIEFSFVNRSRYFNIDEVELEGYRYAFKPLEGDQESANAVRDN